LEKQLVSRRHPRQLYAASDMNAPAARKFRDPSLVDFGTAAGVAGRRLELLGSVFVDRPLLQPDLPRRRTPYWNEAVAVFHAGREGGWTVNAPLPDPWRVAVMLPTATLSLEVRPAPSGQIGVFLEQADQWEWLATKTPAGSTMLSLFAHSGAATLSMATAGAHVVHVDASRQAIALARRNAEASGLADAPIRWVCEDARTFVARELRRGARYDGVVFDPPSWGHGPKGQAFAIDRDLMPLAADLAALTATTAAGGSAGPVLLTCHSPRWHHRQLRDTLAEVFGSGGFESGPLTCTDAAGRTLELGDFARRCPG
jgi:23S rRNA (cytosine1962-C5)-methyltransferase